LKGGDSVVGVIVVYGIWVVHSPYFTIENKEATTT